MGEDWNVLDTENNIRYRFTDKLPEGATSEVRVAEAVDQPGASGLPRVAVKVSKGEEWNKNFERELEVIRAIRHVSSNRYCVSAHDGQLRTDSSRKALVMDLLPSNCNVFQYDEVARATRLYDEDTCLRLGEQYAELLTLLHTDLKITCNDRKETDLYWIPQESRLVVLDWNVTREMSGTSSTEDRRRVSFDIQKLGVILYKLAVGPVIPDRLQVDDSFPRVPKRWLELRLGTRRLICRALNAPSGGFKSAEECLESIKRFLSVRKTSPLVMAQKIIEANSQLQGGGLQRFSNGELENLSEVADMLFILSEPHSEQRNAAESFLRYTSDQRQTILQTVEQRLTQVRTDIEGNISPRALQGLQNMPPLSGLPASVVAKAARLTTLVQVLEAARDAGEQTWLIKDELLKAFDLLQEKRYFDAVAFLEELLRKAPDGFIWRTEPSRILTRLLEEARLCAAFSEAEGACAAAARVPDGDPLAYSAMRNALARLAEAELEKQTIEIAIPELDTELTRALFPALNPIAADMERRSNFLKEANQAYRQREESRRSRISEIVSLLQQGATDSDGRLAWPQKLAEYLVSSDSLNDLEFEPLQKIHQTVTSGRLSEAIELASDLCNKRPDWEPGIFARKLCNELALQIIKATQGARSRLWPEEVAEALQLIKLLSMGAQDLSTKAELDQCRNNLEQRQQARLRLCKELGDPSGPDEVVSNPRTPDILKQAADAGIEIFSRDLRESMSLQGLSQFIAIKKAAEERISSARDVAVRIEEARKELQKSTAELAQAFNDASDQVRLANSLEPIKRKMSELSAELRFDYAAQAKRILGVPEDLEARLAKLEEVNQTDAYQRPPNATSDTQDSTAQQPSADSQSMNGDEVKRFVDEYSDVAQRSGCDWIEDFGNGIHKILATLYGVSEQDYSSFLALRDHHAEIVRLREDIERLISDWNSLAKPGEKGYLESSLRSLLTRTSEVMRSNLEPNLDDLMVKLSDKVMGVHNSLVDKYYRGERRYQNCADLIALTGILAQHRNRPKTASPTGDREERLGRIAEVLSSKPHDPVEASDTNKRLEKELIGLAGAGIDDPEGTARQIASLVNRHRLWRPRIGDRQLIYLGGATFALVVFLALVGTALWISKQNFQPKPEVEATRSYPARMTLQSGSTALPSDGVSEVDILAILRDQSDRPVEDGTQVQFRVDPPGRGSVRSPLSSTVNGMAATRYVAAKASGDVRIIAETVQNRKVAESIVLKLTPVQTGMTQTPTPPSSLSTTTAYVATASPAPIATNAATPRQTPLWTKGANAKMIDPHATVFRNADLATPLWQYDAEGKDQANNPLLAPDVSIITGPVNSMVQIEAEFNIYKGSLGIENNIVKIVLPLGFLRSISQFRMEDDKPLYAKLAETKIAAELTPAMVIGDPAEHEGRFLYRIRLKGWISEKALQP